MSSLEYHAVSVETHVPGHQISIKDMYSLASKDNTTWGISGYKVPREYLDAKQMKMEREGTQKKVSPKPLKKSDYLTDTVKNASKTPAPNHYEIVKPWFDTKKQNQSPSKSVGKRRTFLEEIELEGKRRPIPGPGAYDLSKKDSKKSESIKPRGGDRVSFLNDYEYVADALPGPGNYNPRPIQTKVREAKLKPEDWRKKHKDAEGSRKLNLPDVGTYSPNPANYMTFDKIFEKQKSNKGAGKSKQWGTDVRFSFERKSNKPSLAPGPGQYNVLASWGPDTLKPQKDENTKKGNTNLFNRITKGITKSIYYS